MESSFRAVQPILHQRQDRKIFRIDKICRHA